MNTRRLNFDITQEMREVLDRLSQRRGESISTVVRTAIALLKTVDEAESTGLYPALIDRDGKIVARLIGI